MYSEIIVIEQIKCKKTRLEILLLFIEEYSGWLQHLNNVGIAWGAEGEAVGANKEAVKTREHIDLLKNKVLELFN